MLKQVLDKATSGGAALEYVIISTFSILLSIASIAAVSAIYKDRLETIAQKLGIEFNFDSLSLFSDEK